MSLHGTAQLLPVMSSQSNGPSHDMMWGSPEVESHFPGIQENYYCSADIDGMHGIMIAQGTSSPYKHHGDFYCQPDDVSRGVSISGAPIVPMPIDDGSLGEMMVGSSKSLVSMPGQESLLGKVMGDVFSSSQESQGSSCFRDHGGFPDASRTHAERFQPGFRDHGGFPDASRTHAERFQPGDAPPPQPKSKHFRFEPTTVYMKTDMPHTLGLGVLDFLDSQIVASVSKVNRKKYTIKANAFVEELMCSTKIRIWKIPQKQEDHGRGEFALEFQRRAGDPFTFGDVYRQACFFLSERFPGVMRGRPANPGQRLQWTTCLPSLILDGSGSGSADVEPLLDMAAMGQLPAVQAEAAATLARLSCKDPDLAKLLCKEDSFDQFVKLLASDHLDVTYPTSRLLSSLMMHKEVECPLSNHCLLKVAIQKVASHGTDRIVRLELVKAVSAAVRRCVGSISASAAHEWRATLEEALRDLHGRCQKDASMAEILVGLQDALLELNQYCPMPKTD